MELTVLEIYTQGDKGWSWKEVNKKITIENIYLMFKSGEIITANIKTKDTYYHGRDFNIYNFFDKYKKEILIGLIKKAELQKQELFNNFRSRREALTSYSGIDKAEVEIYKSGLYFHIDGGCRTSINFFINNKGDVIRKPRKIELISKTDIWNIEA